MVSNRGVVEVVLLPLAEWERLKDERRPTLKELLLMPGGQRDLYIPPQEKAKRQPPVEFDED